MGKATAAEATSNPERRRKKTINNASQATSAASLWEIPQPPLIHVNFAPSPHHKITDPAHYGYP
jgi:hypothetical protein